VNRLPSGFFDCHTLDLAKKLPGMILQRTFSDGEIVRVRITETEAYHQDGDEASHSFKGRTKRNSAMFGPPGRLYVYLIYGIHHCLNVVSEAAGIGAAVLIRGGTALTGEARMAANRGMVRDPKNLLNGPGKLCQALQIDLSWNNHDLSQGGFILLSGDIKPGEQLSSSTRIGISKSVEKPWRFLLEDPSN